MRTALYIVVSLALATPGATEPSGRVWEINGIRLEEDQVERLASDIARSTVLAVERLEGMAVHEHQVPELEKIYHDVALGVYGDCIDIVNRTDLKDGEKESLVTLRVIAGQERSTLLVERVLDPGQYETYRAWEIHQVEAFRKRGLWSRSNRRARRRR